MCWLVQYITQGCEYSVKNASPSPDTTTPCTQPVRCPSCSFSCVSGRKRDEPRLHSHIQHYMWHSRLPWSSLTTRPLHSMLCFIFCTDGVRRYLVCLSETLSKGDTIIARLSPALQPAERCTISTAPYYVTPPPLPPKVFFPSAACNKICASQQSNRCGGL